MVLACGLSSGDRDLSTSITTLIDDTSYNVRIDLEGAVGGQDCVVYFDVASGGQWGDLTSILSHISLAFIGIFS